VLRSHHTCSCTSYNHTTGGEEDNDEDAKKAAVVVATTSTTTASDAAVASPYTRKTIPAELALCLDTMGQARKFTKDDIAVSTAMHTFLVNQCIQCHLTRFHCTCGTYT
jgi:hypothetical protein